MQNTRTEILDYLNTHPSSSATEMGRFLEMTPANIRYHLAILEEGSLVQVSGQRTAGGAGRPILLYNLTPQFLGDNLPKLVEVMFDAFNELADPFPILDMIASNLSENNSTANANPITRYNFAVEKLNRLKYHANWGAHPEGPRVELRHCPYKEIAQKNSLICQVDQLLLSRLFRIPLNLTRKREFGSNPFSPCIFQTIQLEE
jgi:predicted ArsR family transcriptional regulator